MTTRYVWRVVVDGITVRHYHGHRAAFHRAAEISTRDGFTEAEVCVERSLPVKFIDKHGGTAMCARFVNGVHQ